MTTELLPAFSRCPKCALITCFGIKHCPGCDDFLEAEHIHRVCLCGFTRKERCATQADLDRLEGQRPKPVGFFRRIWPAIKFVFTGNAQ